ncbi:MAG TPA: triose-phosphate isomerase [Marinobacter sp.]|uniref:Triosephosphate isomerase n=2 Tax=root TaxID=1 RepID=A0A831R5C2_9GAMM|nr:triose-phosphate isomerase [Marinobacter antarcticus]HDZ36791.1 triose-phosphate isomerase [Marinobacter sp.]HEA53093.1 triose-phosphate isomerase [Marinobacter antarcticus]
MRKPVLIGNWKMNGSLQANQALMVRLLPRLRLYRKSVDLAVCPPLPYLFQVRDLLGYTGIALGAQNASAFVSGAYTGEVSATMLQEMGCRYVLVGHSERRTLYGESNQEVAARFRAVMNLGLTPVLCVGESLDERETEQTSSVVESQIQAVIDEVGFSALANGVVAYEPVWAIGTGRTATPEQVSVVHQNIRGFIAANAPEASQDISEGLRIIYGGSVKPSNALDLFSLADVDGGLIGGASLHAEDFGSIAGSLAKASGILEGECETH